MSHPSGNSNVPAHQQLSALIKRREQLEDDLKNAEKQIFDLEESYIGMEI
jgi:uncharacterized protein (UPF0335 family)